MNQKKNTSNPKKKKQNLKEFLNIFDVYCLEGRRELRKITVSRSTVKKKKHITESDHAPTFLSLFLYLSLSNELFLSLNLCLLQIPSLSLCILEYV